MKFSLLKEFTVKRDFNTKTKRSINYCYISTIFYKIIDPALFN